MWEEINLKKNFKMVIVILIVLTILISLILIILRRKTLENEKAEDEEFEVTVSNEVSRVISQQEFFNVATCVQDYIDYLEDNNQDAVYKVLDENFKNSKNISNINELKGDIIESEENQFIPLKMNKIEKEIDKIVYFVYGKITDEMYNNEKEYYFTVVIDNSQSVFSIIPESLESEREYKYNLDIKDDTIDFYNEFLFKTFSEEEILLKYFDYYKKLAINNPKKAFLLLNEDYRKKRFDNNEEKYLEYLKDIDINNIELSKYISNFYEDYTEYVCINDNESCYIVNETAPMEFSLKLDTYTIDLPEFIEKYNKGNEQVKVGMNIEKIIEAINTKDYGYVYDKLDETFKKNNFDNVEAFKEYVINNFYEYNDIEYTNFSKEGNIYIYKTKIKNVKDEKSDKKDCTIIMKLLEDSNFVMSFNIE